MSDWRVAFHQLKIEDDVEAQSFLEALNQMNQHRDYGRLLTAVVVPDLHLLFRQLLAAQTPFSLAMNPRRGDLLVRFLHSIFKESVALPSGSVALKCFINMCCKELDRDALKRVVDTDMLGFLQVDKLQALALKPVANVKAIIDFFYHRDQLAPADFELGLKMLLAARPHELGHESAEYLIDFLNNVLTYYVKRFSGGIEKRPLYAHPKRILEWWGLWKRHKFKDESYLAEDDPYYQTDFPTIIKYVPRFIWWNNGMQFGKGNRYYHFGSPEFRHLATGGSIRNGFDPRPYTRRMAREFVNLPCFLLEHHHDLYLYLYGKSLGAGALLLQLIPEFIRHHEDVEALSQELERWNPVIQKLASPVFEALDQYTARDLLGFLYHCLRDKPHFSVRGRSVEALIGAKDRYLTRIDIRARARRERANRRASARRARLLAAKRLDYWKPHPRIKPMQFKAARAKYQIVELTNVRMLQEEGRVMKHCVGSYKQRCLQEQCSVWSLRQYRERSWYSLVTIEVIKKRIVQARAVCNALPKEEYRKLIESWASKECLKYEV